MSWLSDRMIQYVFTNGEDEIIIEAPAKDDPPEAPEGYKYKGFIPEKVNLMTKVQFEQNGRVGYRISVGDGKQVYRSATRERYEHIVGNTGGARLRENKSELQNSVYTKSYGEAVKKAETQKKEKQKQTLNKILKGGK